MPKLLVTGGAGFIGANFVQYTLDHHPEYAITVLDKLTYAGNASNLPHALDKISFVTGDICDKALVDSLVADVDIVVHFAAETHDTKSFRDPWPFVITNLNGTATILEAIRKHNKRLHHITTEEVFGDLPPDAPSFTEESRYRPNTPHASTKAGSDWLVRAWIDTYGIRATLSASSNVYGPYQHVEKFIPRTITNILTNQSPVVYGTGEQVRGWLHVDEHSKAIHTILKYGMLGELYLVGPDEHYTNNQIVELLLVACGKDSHDYRHIADRPVNNHRSIINCAKLKALGWSPDYHQLSDTLPAITAWYAANREWWQKDKQAVEQQLSDEN